MLSFVPEQNNNLLMKRSYAQFASTIPNSDIRLRHTKATQKQNTRIETTHY